MLPGQVMQLLTQSPLTGQKLFPPSSAQVVALGAAHVDASAVYPVQALHESTQVLLLARASDGQKFFPLSAAQVAAFGTTHVTALAVYPVQSKQEDWQLPA